MWWGKSTARGYHDTPKAVTRCAPILDAGTTRGDAAGVKALCYHFAAGAARAERVRVFTSIADGV